MDVLNQPALTKKNILKEEAIAILRDMQEGLKKYSIFAQTWQPTLNLLLNIINGTQSAEGIDIIRSAAVIDDPNKGSPILFTLLEKGIKYTQDDIEFIRCLDKRAATLLENNISTQLKENADDLKI